MSLPAGVFFTNSILNLHQSGSLLSLSSNALINLTTRALGILSLSSGLVKNTFLIISFGDGPITTISFPSWSKRGSSNLSRRINSHCSNTGAIFSPLTLRKNEFLFFWSCCRFICQGLGSSWILILPTGLRLWLF